jgi:hypothetical protein
MREGYIGILLVFVFSVFAASFMMSLPDLRIYRNTVNMLNGLAIPARTIPETVDIDDAVVGSIVVLAVPESTIGMSFDAYRSARKSQDYARDMEKALIASDWKFLSRSLGTLFMPVTNGEYSALVPYLREQIDGGFVSPNVLVVQGGESSLRYTWDLLKNRLASMMGISYFEFVW